MPTQAPNPFAGLPRHLPYSRSDIVESLADFFTLSANLPTADEPHPIAEFLRMRSVTMLDLAANIAGVAQTDDPVTARRALTTADFQDSLSAAGTRIIGTRFDQQAAEHRKLCRDFPTRGLKPLELPIVEIGEPSKEPGASGPIRSLTTVTPGGTARPFVFSARFLLSRELMLSDGRELYALILNQLAGHAARLEAAQLAAAINDNVTLADGSPLIGASNTGSATGLDVSSLDSAMSVLRSNVTAAGSIANVRARYLLIPPGKEASAGVLVSSLTPPGSSAPRLEVVVNPWLSGSDYYLLADPNEACVFARTFPDGWGGKPEILRSQSNEIDDAGNVSYYDGNALLFTHVVGVHAVDRTGIVKIAAS